MPEKNSVNDESEEENDEWENKIGQQQALKKQKSKIVARIQRCKNT